MSVLSTVILLHNHQPIGNFDGVIEDAYRRGYRPFLDLLDRFPSIRFTQHWTGPLLEWLLRKHPDCIELMREMVRRGQLELLTGAYYEAILAVIPERDRIGQIRKLTDFIHRHFDAVPRGMWLAERVWEQPLVRSLAEAGVEFVAVDDTHFRLAGLGEEELYGCYITEEGGRTLRLLPLDKKLRYTIPFAAPEETLDYLRRLASGGEGRTVVAGDDGEKLGVWPKTHEHVYRDGWLERFCLLVRENESWLRTIHMSEAALGSPPRGRVYLPTASYPEMMRWALPPRAAARLEFFEKELRTRGLGEIGEEFVRGGYWRNFLARYPEANHMHKRMLRVAARLHAAAGRLPVPPGVFDSLWAGQCNDPYWHGVFGGLYLPSLRFPVYRSLLEAEVSLDGLEKVPPVRLERTDFDCDGAEEVIVESADLNLYVKPSLGGSLVELDFKPVCFNLQDVVSRTEEGYHRRLREPPGQAEGPGGGYARTEEGLERLLVYDWYRHASLVDHFFDAGTTLESFARCAYGERGDFVNRPYEVESAQAGSVAEVTLVREGALWEGAGPHRLAVRKTIRHKPGTGSYSAAYLLINRETRPVDLRFGVEFVVGLMAGSAPDRYYRIGDRKPPDARLASAGEEKGVTRFSLVDEWLGIETVFTLDREAVLWRCPLETVSLSEAGLERIFQGSIMVPHWTLRLERELSCVITQSVLRLGPEGG
ncbi:MAG: alpha-amylase/4-alpha-glucanotransferase domain-containing protein [Bacteroidota bacterium]